jgi:biopolymer transport protein ExbD
MNQAFNSPRRRRRPTINITPLIDVLFLLLIFLMVSATFREHLGIDIDLPQAGASGNQEVAPYEITVTKMGKFYFRDRQVNEAQLREAMAQTIASEPDAVLALRADEGADFGTVVRAIDIAREVGGKRLVIPTRPIEIETP